MVDLVMGGADSLYVGLMAIWYFDEALVFDN